MAKWSVVCTVKSTKLYVSHFIAHYVALGAEEILIYFDDPAQAEYDEAAGQGRVTATICGPQYWATNKRRNRSIEARQMANYDDAKTKTQSDWLLHVDVDELLYAQSDVGKILDELSDDTFSVIVPPMEAIWEAAPEGLEVFQTPWFRRKLPRNRIKPVARVYRPEVAAMMRNGLFGHRRGKSFTNINFPFAHTGIHAVEPEDTTLVCNVKSPDLALLHYEGMAFEDWKHRALSRMNGKVVATRMSDERKAQMELIAATYEAQGDAGLAQLYEEMYVFDAQRLRKARRSGYVVERRFGAPKQGILHKIKQRFF